MSTDVPMITIAAECPEPDCGLVLCNRQLEQVVFVHLVEEHGCIDTIAHVLAYEATVLLAE